MAVDPVTLFTTPLADANDPSTFAERANTNFGEVNVVLGSLNSSIGQMNADFDAIVASALAGDLPSLTGFGDQFLVVNSGETAATFYDLFTSSNTFSGTNNFTGTLQVDGSEVWHPGNDGAGSGLDADTLDGKQGANYLKSASVDGNYAIGSVILAENVAATTRDYAEITSGINIRRSDAGGNSTGSPLAGSWFALGKAAQNEVTLWERIS